MNFRWPARDVFAVVAVAMVVSTMFGCSGNVTDSRSDGLELEEVVQPAIKISGTIVDADGRPLEGVMVQLDRASKASTATASNGIYEFLALHRGAYSVTPSLVGCSFEPPTVILTGLNTDAVADFRGTGANCRSARDAGAADAAVDVRAADAPAVDAAVDVRSADSVVVDGPVDVGRPETGTVDARADAVAVDACIRKTCISAGVMCGPLADGCGAILQCGSCPSGQTCNIAGQCVCQPITACPAGKNCGAVPDGCGGTIDCGTCTAPQTCGAGGVPNVCGSMAAGCELDTLSCLRTRDNPNDPPSVQCSQCVRDNGCFDLAQQGGTCEDTPGTAPVACQTAIMSSTPVSETKICLATLDRIFLSQCAATFQLTPCLCGTTDAAACLAGTAPPNGPLLSIYQCELGATVAEISASFTDQTKGVGQANALAQCAGAFGCNCF